MVTEEKHHTILPYIGISAILDYIHCDNLFEKGKYI